MANENQGGGLIGMLSKPLMQMGFAGLSAILIGVIVWMINLSESRVDNILQMQAETNKVIQGHTVAMQANTAATRELSRMVSQYQRPE